MLFRYILCDCPRINIELIFGMEFSSFGALRWRGERFYLNYVVLLAHSSFYVCVDGTVCLTREDAFLNGRTNSSAEY